MEKYPIKNMKKIIKLFLCLFKKYSKDYHFGIQFCSVDVFLFYTLNAETLWTDPESPLRYKNLKEFTLYFHSNGKIIYNEKKIHGKNN